MHHLSKRLKKLDWGTAIELEDINGQVAIVGIGETAYTAASNRDAKAMALEAIENALNDASISPGEVDGLMTSPAIADQITPNDFHAYFATSQPVWFSKEGGAMIWGATCTHTAAHAFSERKANCIVNVFSVDWATKLKTSTSTPGDWHFSEPMKSAFEIPFGWYPQMIYFATFANRHMFEYGTTHEQLAEIPITFRKHANGHSEAIMRKKELTLESYLSRPITAFPFRKEDCCLISDGAAAFIMRPTDQAYDAPVTPVIVEGVGRGKIDCAPYISQQRDLTSTPQVFSAPWALGMAGRDIKEIDVLSVYDCFSMTALMQIEDMGFCEKGEGGAFIQNDRLHFDRPRELGGIPCNTHGGLLSHAYVLGIAHIVELIKQLRGVAHNQVKNAQLAAYAGFTADEASTLILRRG